MRCDRKVIVRVCVQQIGFVSYDCEPLAIGDSKSSSCLTNLSLSLPDDPLYGPLQHGEPLAL